MNLSFNVSIYVFWSQDPYNWSVVFLVVGTQSKILLENSLNWKFSKLKVFKIEGCQNWKLPILKLPKLKVAKIEVAKMLKIGNC